jgi:TonB family protein
MKINLLIFVWCAVLSAPLLAQVQDSSKTIPSSKDEVFLVKVFENEFPGGNDALTDFIYDNLKYPLKAKLRRIQGTVVIKFMVEKQGKVTRQEIIQDIGGGCGAEALRIVKMMPAWEFGRSRGRKGNFEYLMQVEFKLKMCKLIKPMKIHLQSKQVL